MTKFMDAVEFEEWSQRHTPAECEQKMIELQSQVRELILEETGTSLEDFQHATRDGREMIEEFGEAKITAKELASDVFGQMDVQRAFCDLHPDRFPSEANTEVLQTAYMKHWRAVNPDLTPFWHLDTMQEVFDALEAANAFPVERIVKS